jgi:hypothetical protein
MKAVLTILAACLITFLLATTWAGAQSASERPPGVDEETWIALSPNAGIVLRDATSAPPPSLYRFENNQPVAIPQPQRATGTPMTGVLMARVNGVWARVDLEPPAARVQPVHK